MKPRDANKCLDALDPPSIRAALHQALEIGQLAVKEL